MIEGYSVQIILPLEYHILLEDIAQHRNEKIIETLQYLIIEKFDEIFSEIREKQIDGRGD